LGTNTTCPCSPTWSGLGFDKHLTLILLRVGHQATWGGSYSRNSQTSENSPSPPEYSA
jgi:hypothetical protein